MLDGFVYVVGCGVGEYVCVGVEWLCDYGFECWW